MKPFYRQDKQISLDYLDLTDLSRSLRSPEFSQDYLDVSDLRSGRSIPFDYVDVSVDLNLNFDSRVPEARRSGGAKARASIYSSDTDIVKDIFKETPKRFKVVPSDSSDKSSKSDSSVDSKSNEKLNDEKKFATDNTDSEDNMKDEKDSDNSNNESEEKITSSKKVRTPKSSHGAKVTDKNRVVYMQSLNKVIDADGRRRLTHFLPKRFHWKEEEFDNLGYFWFNGHRGKYAEPWRVD
ncbi:hypothetical protein K1T71_014880 [Dendrolimus kikuchii]|nr:hypothetical protein K1T71_014880 [Dendrolimus kikuchii]